MRLKTSAGYEYTALWADTAQSGMLHAQIADDRRIPAIALEFDGLDWLERISPEEGDKRFEGYGRLTRIFFAADGVIQIALERVNAKEG